jgi:hypothetical protein
MDTGFQGTSRYVGALTVSRCHRRACAIGIVIGTICLLHRGYQTSFIAS